MTRNSIQGRRSLHYRTLVMLSVRLAGGSSNENTSCFRVRHDTTKSSLSEAEGHPLKPGTRRATRRPSSIARCLPFSGARVHWVGKSTIRRCRIHAKLRGICPRFMTRRGTRRELSNNFVLGWAYKAASETGTNEPLFCTSIRGRITSRNIGCRRASGNRISALSLSPAYRR